MTGLRRREAAQGENGWRGTKFRPIKGVDIPGSGRASNLFVESRAGDSGEIPEVDGAALDVGGPCV